jgi:hypothetical protein
LLDFADEILVEGGLAAPRRAGDEDRAPTPTQRVVPHPVEVASLLVAADQPVGRTDDPGRCIQEITRIRDLVDLAAVELSQHPPGAGWTFGRVLGQQLLDQGRQPFGELGAILTRAGDRRRSFVRRTPPGTTEAISPQRYRPRGWLEIRYYSSPDRPRPGE